MERFQRKPSEEADKLEALFDVAVIEAELVRGRGPLVFLNWT